MIEKTPKRPLTIPIQIETIDGVEWLSFVYTAKGVSTDYRVRIDTDSVDLNNLSEEFKTINSVYPKANVDRSSYKGNRWDYETSVNEIGWKLCFLNQELLTAKRGLLQRAVDRLIIHLTIVLGIDSHPQNLGELHGSRKRLLKDLQ